jgi:hypothetical protein
VGVNGGNPQHVRKVVWWGEVCEVMTFAEAYTRLQGERFKKLRSHRVSPLHVQPMAKADRLVGYKHVSEEHIKDHAWVSDLVSKDSERRVRREGRKLLLVCGQPWDAFDRDCCMLLKNGFFATGTGIELDDEGVKLLREAQPTMTDINAYAVFGLTANGKANGLRGTFLELTGRLADRFLSWLRECSSNTTNIANIAVGEGEVIIGE